MFGNMNIRRRLMLTIYAYLFIILLLLLIITYFVVQNIFLRQVRTALQNSAINGNLLIEKEQQYLYGMAAYYGITPEIQKILAQSNQHLDSGGLTNELFAVSKARMYVLNLALYNLQGDCVDYVSIDDSFGPVNQLLLPGERPFDRLLAGQRTFEWEFIDSNETLLFERDNSPKICLWYVIKSTTSMKPIGVLAISIDTRKLLTTDNLTNEMYNNAVILDSNARTLFVKGTSRSMLNTDMASQLLGNIQPYQSSGSFLFTNSGSKYVAAYARVSNSPFVTFIVKSRDNLNWNPSTMRIYFGVSLALALLMLPVGLFIQRNITRPLNMLIDSMSAFRAGNRNIQLPFRYKDEIGRLGTIFNQMVCENNDLIDRTYIEKIRRQEAELTSLQAQINPHFLYNMINYMQWAALKRGETEIAEIAYSMGRVFRMGLNRGHSMVPVAQECELIEYYIGLQEKRFENRMTFSMDVEESVLSCPIPKLIVQPLVENAILHGVDSSAGRISVQVRIFPSEDKRRLLIQVLDDGVGIPDEILRQLPDRYVPEDYLNRGGYALKNIYDRLSLKYPGAFRFQFFSEVKKYTRVEIELPLESPQDSDAL